MLYKYIELPNWKTVSSLLLETIPDEHKYKTLFKSNGPNVFKNFKLFVDMIETFCPWNNIHNVALISVRPNDVLPLHTDFMVPSRYALNIPVFNCEKTYTVFYQAEEGYEPEFLKNVEAPRYLFDRSRVKEVGRLFLTQPALFDTQTPHEVVNNTEDYRIILSVRFNSIITV